MSRASFRLRTSSAPKMPRAVEKMRGPMIAPDSTRSAYVMTSGVIVCGSRVVVMP
jgi:hypothetical protein